jgi:hypothetical protein
MKLTSEFTSVRVAAPQMEGMPCPYCGGPIRDLWAERTPTGSGPIVAGEKAIDCYYCRNPLQLLGQGQELRKAPSGMEVVRRSKQMMLEWLGSYGGSLSRKSSC